MRSNNLSMVIEHQYGSKAKDAEVSVNGKKYEITFKTMLQVGKFDTKQRQRSVRRVTVRHQNKNKNRRCLDRFYMVSKRYTTPHARVTCPAQCPC